MNSGLDILACEAREDSHWGDDIASYLSSGLESADPDVFDLVAHEGKRQAASIELIASENVVSRAVLDAQGSWFCNKTVEGYPGNRYHAGSEIADQLETLAQARACKLFGAAFANVQPHSGSQANAAVLKALLKPGERILAMDLRAGGHLSHGSNANLSGQVYETHFYGVRQNDGWLDYGKLGEMARKLQPKVIIAGGSSYPRALDLQELRDICDSIGARLLVDMAHFAGLVAGKVIANPVDYADVVTTTTYKSLRGARGGLILWNLESLTAKFSSGVFPGVQGSPLLNMIAAKAVSLGEALSPSFADYAKAVQTNARVFAETLIERGLNVMTHGTDTPLILLDLRESNLTGAFASDLLSACGITCNKNLVPGDTRNPRETSGLRFGVSAMTTRGMCASDAGLVANWIADTLVGNNGRPMTDDTENARFKERAERLALSYSGYQG